MNPMANSTKILADHQRLAAEVEAAAGFDVTCTKDCQVLSAELKTHDPRFTVSTSTLKRFFGLVQNTSAHSESTLNALARFVGSTSYRRWLERSTLNKVATLTNPESVANVPSVGPVSDEDLKQRIRVFLHQHRNEAPLQLRKPEFDRLRFLWFEMYRRGTFDMALWSEIKKHAHIHNYILEQFPPLDFMASFGEVMVREYLDQSSNPLQRAYGQGIIAAGMVAKGKPWPKVMEQLPRTTKLDPNAHPLVQARNLGIILLGLKETGVSHEQHEETKALILKGLKEDKAIWPQWCHHQCYFAFNLADWAVMAEDLEVIEAVQENILAFRQTSDKYGSDLQMELLLDLRILWHHIMLGQKEQASSMYNELDGHTFHTMESRTLRMWMEGARAIFRPGARELALGEMMHASILSRYSGFYDRIHSLTLQHLD